MRGAERSYGMAKKSYGKAKNKRVNKESTSDKIKSGLASIGSRIGSFFSRK